MKRPKRRVSSSDLKDDSFILDEDTTVWELHDNLSNKRKRTGPQGLEPWISWFVVRRLIHWATSLSCILRLDTVLGSSDLHNDSLISRLYPPARAIFTLLSRYPISHEKLKLLKAFVTLLAKHDFLSFAWLAINVVYKDCILLSCSQILQEN